MGKVVHINKDGSKIIDCTQDIVIVDIVNAMGETYHFENKPDEPDKLPIRSSASPDEKDGAVINIFLHLGVSDEKIENAKRIATKNDAKQTLRPKKKSVK